MAASISASTSPAVRSAAALGDKTTISGRNQEDKPPGDYDQAGSYNNFSSDCLWSTPVNSSPTRRVPPPSYYSPQAGNPHSKYQYYFLDLKSCKCPAGKHVDFSSCEIKEQPVCNPYEHTLQRCLNCASLLHGVFGCQQPLKAAVITWHSNKVPSAFGVIEFATDLRIGRYNINGRDWEALKQDQAKKIAALSSAEDKFDTKETEQSEEDTKDKIWKRIAEEALSSPKPHKRKRMDEAEDAPEASRSHVIVARSSARHTFSPEPALPHSSLSPNAPVSRVDEDPFNNQFNSQLTPASPQLQGDQSDSKFPPEATASNPQVQLNVHSDQFDNKTSLGSYRPQPLGTSTAPQHNKPRKASDYSLHSLNSGATPFSSRGPTPTSGISPHSSVSSVPLDPALFPNK